MLRALSCCDLLLQPQAGWSLQGGSASDRQWLVCDHALRMGHAHHLQLQVCMQLGVLLITTSRAWQVAQARNTAATVLVFLHIQLG